MSIDETQNEFLDEIVVPCCRGYGVRVGKGRVMMEEGQ